MVVAFTPELRARARTAEHLPLALDRTSPVPLYFQLFQQLSEAIESGVLKPGDPLENEVSIAHRVELSRPTVRRAIAELTAKGLVVRRRGVGTMVARSAVHRRNELTSLFDDLSDAELDPSTTVVEFSQGRVDQQAADALGLPRTTRLVYIERVRSTSDGPIAVLRNWLPPSFTGITVANLIDRGLYKILRTNDVYPAVAHQSIGSRSATESERRLLHLGRNDPVLTVSRRTFDAAGAPVEVGEHSYRFDAYRYDVSVYAS